MSMQRIRRAKKKTKQAVEIIPAAMLTSPAGMGGIIGAGGYDFQTRFIVCKIPHWLTEGGLVQLFHEGTGDVDIRCGDGKLERLVHVQVKDHEVSPTEFRDAVTTFVAFDNGKPGIYDHFVLTCPSLHPRLRALEKALKRIRDATPFYETNAKALDAEKKAIREGLAKFQLTQHSDFILEKLHFQIESAQFSDDGIAGMLFVSGLQRFPDYQRSSHDELLPVYAELLKLVSSHRGKILERRVLENAIASSIHRLNGKEPTAIYFDVHNWTRENYEPKAHYELDWSAHFNRGTRTIPTAEIFGTVLLPELYSLQKRIAGATSERLIKFRGKCCLSTGLVIGAAFPENGGWIFEVSQPQMPTPWRSNASPAVAYPVQTEETMEGTTGDSVAFVFSVTGDAVIEVQEFIQRSGLKVKALLSVKPANEPGSRSILNASEAASLALASRDYLKKSLLKNRVHTTHLFFYGPMALAIFLGQKLTSLGKIYLYEYTNPGYVLTSRLST